MTPKQSNFLNNITARLISSTLAIILQNLWVRSMFTDVRRLKNENEIMKVTAARGTYLVLYVNGGKRVETKSLERLAAST